MKIRPVGAKFSHADGRTDSQKLVVAFHNFAKAPKMTKIKCIYHCTYFSADPSDRDCGFEFYRGHGCLSVVLCVVR